MVGVAPRDFLDEYDDDDQPHIEFEDLTQDHKCDIDEEKERIEASGGEVRALKDDHEQRCFVKGENYPALAIARTLGDVRARKCGVTEKPDVEVHQVEEDWRFMILASDGVWQFLTSNEAVDIVSDFPPDEVQTSAEALAAEAWNKWVDCGEQVVDDITVLVYWFREK